jgi:uncharacterized membrane protein
VIDLFIGDSSRRSSEHGMASGPDRPRTAVIIRGQERIDDRKRGAGFGLGRRAYSRGLTPGGILAVISPSRIVHDTERSRRDQPRCGRAMRCPCLFVLILLVAPTATRSQEDDVVALAGHTLGHIAARFAKMMAMAATATIVCPSVIRNPSSRMPRLRQIANRKIR